MTYYDENLSDVKNFWQSNYVDKNYVVVICDINFRFSFLFRTSFSLFTNTLRGTSIEFNNFAVNLANMNRKITEP